jgi:NADPH2 dehydrogenase
MTGIFTPLRVKHLKFENRIVMPPMATERSQPDGAVKAESVAYYGEMAARGMGLLIVEHNFIAPEGRASPGQMSIADDREIAGHQELTRIIHENGVLSALQVSHTGSNRLETVVGQCLGASPVAHPSSRLTPRELSAGEIAGIVTAFGMAASRGKQAGYDLVEIHSAHGYLLNQFLSPLTNRRGDRYGGSPANRRRLLMEAVEEARGKVGADYPLMVRLGLSDNPPGLDLYPGGLDLEEGVAAARAVVAAGIDILDISGGLCGSRPAGLEGEAYFLPWLQALRPAVRVHLILTGGIREPGTAAAVLLGGSVDLVGVGRALAADPQWMSKAKDIPRA